MKNFIYPFLIVAGLLTDSCSEKVSNEPQEKPVVVSESNMIIPRSPDTILSNGRRNIFLVSRRELPGLFVERAIFPPGYRSNPHLHPVDMNITVISGAINLALTSQNDTSVSVNVYGPGSFIIIPANQAHFEWFTDTTMMDITGIGPMNTVNLPIVHSTNQ